MGIPLQSYWAPTRRCVTNTFIGALCNALPSVATWGGFLLSLVAWMHFGHIIPVPAVRCAQCNDMHGCTGSSVHAVGYYLPPLYKPRPCPSYSTPPPRCISHALVQATVGVGTVLICDLILIRYQT